LEPPGPAPQALSAHGDQVAGLLLAGDRARPDEHHVSERTGGRFFVCFFDSFLLFFSFFFGFLHFFLEFFHYIDF
jgi:hypothetical protein